MEKKLFRFFPMCSALWKSKFFRMMKTTVFLLMVFLNQAFALESYSQRTTLDLDLRNVSVQEVLNKIEDQSEFYFMFESSTINVDRTVSINVNDRIVTEVLDEIFENTDVSYKINNRQIALTNSGAETERISKNDSQQKQITGKVSGEDGNPIIGVTVAVIGTTNGTITDFEGNFSLQNITSDDVLSFTFIGMQSQEIVIGTQSRIDVVLKEETIGIEEVVAVGYGVQKKSNIAGAISSVKSEDMASRSVTNVVDAMAGKTAGVSIVSTGGAPGETGSMLVRGYSSNESSNPLYVVDGLRLGDISGIDPNTIESIEILKDAASAAIYGAEAGNGVILVTTKKGTSGTSKISYEFQYTINSMVRAPEALDAQEYVDWLIVNGKYTQNDVDATIAAGLWDGVSSTDWMDEMTETGFAPRHTLSFQGGNEKGSYYISLGHTDQDGIVVSDYDTYKRINATLNASYKFKPWLEIGNNTNFMHNSTTSVAGGAGLNNSFFGAVYYFDPTVRVSYSLDNLPTYMQSYIDEGKELLTDDQGDYYGISQLISTNPCNPWVTLKSTQKENTSYMLSGSAYTNITPLDDLTFTSRLGYKLNQNQRWNVDLKYYGGPSDYANNASVDRSLMQTIYYQWENFANYNFTLGDVHDFTTMLGMSYSQNTMYYMYGEESKIREDVNNNPLFWDLAYAASDSEDDVVGTHDWQRKLSYYGRVNYNYDNRYTLEFTMRADAADLSILSNDNRWGYFPAVSGGWQASNESWFPEIYNIDYVKFRGSWGQNGSTSNLSNYAYATTIATNSLGYSFDGQSYTVSATTSGLSNDDLKWETSEQIDLGIDLRFFDSRLNFSADWFNKKTKDLILTTGVTVPASAGAEAPVMNGGSVVNRGWEFESGWKDNIGDLNYSINANFSSLHNEVTSINSTVTRYTDNALQSYGDLTAFEVGHPVWYLWTYHCEGIDPETGNAIIADTDGSGSIDVEDKIEAGSGLPDFQYGITLSADYRNFHLTVFGQGVGGNQIFRATGPYQQNTIKYFYDRTWTESTAQTATMSPMNSGNYGYYIVSDAFVFDADYFKIKQIRLGYDLPSSLLKKIKLNNVQFYMSLEDWFCFSSYKNVGMDPSASANSSTGIGIDYGTYPNYKKTVFGINVTF